jgi:uncharacterized membrane protein YczE/cytidylate kinase
MQMKKQSVKVDRAFILLWAKRLFIYLVGLYCMAIGVVFSAKSSLGVSPVGSLANVLYQIGLSEGLPAYVNLGNCTTAVYCLYILTELLILRREFQPKMLLQLVASLLFGQLVNLATAMMAFLPVPPNYGIQMLYLLCSVPLVAAGVMLYLTPNILPTPGEGMSLAISKKTGWAVGSSKTLFDCALVVISGITSLVYFHALVGVREGTVICALLVGYTMKQLQKPFQKPLLRFVEREDRVSRALTAASEGYRLDASGKPKIMITIGREFGSGGYEIGKRLAEKLGITFYDSQINEMASAQSGIPLSKVEELEHHMEREIVYDFKNAAYAMTSGSLSTEEQLFVAQTTVIRQIASGDESCVIMGRCADYVLYEDPNCFRLYIHARPSARIERVMKQYGLSEDQARTQMENTDRSRAQHYRHFTGREYGKQEYYHLSVDSGMLGTEASVDAIVDVIKMWCDVRGTHPLASLLDA